MQIIYLKFQEFLIINNQMIKKVLVVVLTLSLIFSLDPGYQGATLVIRNDKSSSSQKSQPFHLKPVSYASIYPATNKQIVKIIRPQGNDGCKPFQKVISEENYQVFYLVDGNEGLCTFNKRVHNAKRSSANGLIIVNSRHGISNLNLMSNKDYFQVFLLAEEQGSSILSQKSPFFAQINIKKVKSESATAEIWISSLNLKSYDIVAWWSNNLKQIPSLWTRVNWQPRFAYISCKVVGNSNACGGDTASCACGGMFCSPQKHGKTSNVLVREDIRQSLIYKQSSDKFLSYMIEFKQRCLESYLTTGFVQDCANSLLNHLQIDAAALQQKIDRLLFSCENPNFPQTAQFKMYEEMLLDQGRFTQITNYPTITLNHEILNVKNENELRDQLCRKLSLEKEAGCSIQQFSIFEHKSAWGMLLWIIFVLLLVVAAIFAVIKFKNKLRHEMNKELKMQVSTAVEHYFSLTQTNQSK